MTKTPYYDNCTVMNPSPRLKPIPAIIAEIRRLSPLLAEIGEVLSAAAGLSVPMRPVLEHIVDKGPAAVPAIAKARNMSRQHIQTAVNELKGRSLVKSLVNPKHRRSDLIAATERGESTIREIRSREVPVGSKLMAAVSPEDAEIAAATLAKLRRKLESIAVE